jgi:hypothetical protein
MLVAAWYGAALAPGIVRGEAAASVAYYVSPDGDDGNPGTLAAPFATVAGARDAIRSLKAALGELPEGGVTVYLRGGTYHLTEPLVFSEQDSGTALAPVVYTAYQGEEVAWTGGAELPASAFSPVSPASPEYARLPEQAREHVMQISLTSLGIQDYGQLQQVGHGFADNVAAPLEVFFNGDAMTLARYPNEGYPLMTGTVLDTGSIPRNGDMSNRGAVFQYVDPRPESWATAAGDIWMGGYWYWDYSYSTLQVAQINTVQKTIATVQPAYYGINPNKGNRYYYFNILEELDAPGEWYLDRASGQLFFYPPASMEGARLRASILAQDMVRFEQASHITLRGLILEASRASGIVMTGGTGNSIEQCIIRGFGTDGVRITGGTGHRVSGCSLYDIGFNGITMTGGDRTALAPGNHAAENNHLYRFARLAKGYNAGIELSGVGLRASNNLLHDSAHFAIWFSGNEHLIENNEIFDMVKETSDAGAVYAGRDWTFKGNVLRNNYLHDITGPEVGDGHGAHAFYMDDQMSSAEFDGNIIHRVSHNGFLIGGGNDHFIHNNISADNRTGIYVDDRGAPGNWQAAAAQPGGAVYQSLNGVPYQQEPWASRYPEIASYSADSPELRRGVPRGNEVTGNIFFRNQIQTSIAASASQNGTVKDNIIASVNPGFLDPDNRDFRLAYDSPAYAAGFREIDFAAIGLRADFPFPDRDEPLKRLFISGKDGNTILRLEQGQSASTELIARSETGYVAGLTGAAISYTSADPDVAAVNQQGVVTGVNGGATMVTAAVSLNGVTLSTVLHVTVDDALAQLTVEAEKTVLIRGESLRLRISMITEGGLYADPIQASVACSSTSPQVVQMEGCRITALAAGSSELRVTAALAGVMKEAVLHVEVFDSKLSMVRLAADTQALYEGEVLPLALTVRGSGGQPVDMGQADVEYTSSDSSVLSVDSSGTLHGVSPGTATLTATVRVNDEYGMGTLRMTVYPDAVHKVASPWRVNYYGGAEGIVRLDGDGGGVQLETNGKDVFGTADDFLFLSRELAYDGEPQAVIARIESVQNVGVSPTAAGIMFRESNEAGSRNVMMKIKADGKGLLTARQSEDGSTAYTAAGGTIGFPGEIMLIRSGAAGEKFTACYKREDGSWAVFGEYALDGADSSMMAGLAAFSYASQASKADFSMVSAGPLPISQVRLSGESHTVGEGGQLALQLTGLHGGVLPGSLAGAAVSYSSSNPAVAAVTQDGIVQSVSIGEAVITVATVLNGQIFTDTYTISVEPAVFTGIDISEARFAVGAGEAPLELGLKGRMSNGLSYGISELKSRFGAQVEIGSSRTDIASVDQDGIITPGMTPGYTTVSVQIAVYGAVEASSFTLVVHNGIEFSEDFESPQRTWDVWTNEDNAAAASISLENPRTGSRSLKLNQNRMILSRSLSQPFTGLLVGWMYDDGLTPKESVLSVVKRTSANPDNTAIMNLYAGLVGSQSATRYAVRNGTADTFSLMRSKGWHEIMMDNYSTPGKIKVWIDRSLVGEYGGYGITKVSIGDFWTAVTAQSIYFDDIALYRMTPQGGN